MVQSPYPNQHFAEEERAGRPAFPSHMPAPTRSFIYCAKDRSGTRWFYSETPGFRERVPGSSSSFTMRREQAYRFQTKREAWEHCRNRRKGGSHWGNGTKWIVITLRTATTSALPPVKP